ncbi:MAG: glutaredoxin [Candidatus Syntrophoarchaeum butanivorans]|uniref:Glutaredoxin n=1 Tax=Candidatus Syntropharchaeum butanivorans TaxID=1839936 RepID=A0A1F2P3Y8_9EURY|nr:MAG: glutaredoxin [Candidatus Syntrophoarchaeum butanivorans]
MKVYSTPTCPNCERLKCSLKDEGIEYEEVDMMTADAMTELRMNGVFTLSAPVLQIGEDVFLTSSELISEDGVAIDLIKKYLNGGIL